VLYCHRGWLFSNLFSFAATSRAYGFKKRKKPELEEKRILRKQEDQRKGKGLRRRDPVESHFPDLFISMAKKKISALHPKRNGIF
jgi:hypothetical protein